MPPPPEPIRVPSVTHFESDTQRQITMAAWCRFFNMQWLSSKDTVFDILEKLDTNYVSNSQEVREAESTENPGLTVGHTRWGVSAQQAATSPKTYELIVPVDVSRRAEALFDAMDRRCDGYISTDVLNEATGPDWALVSLEMDKGDGKITVESWMRFFNRTWGTSPNNVYLVLEAIESRLSHEQVLRIGQLMQTSGQVTMRRHVVLTASLFAGRPGQRRHEHPSGIDARQTIPDPVPPASGTAGRGHLERRSVSPERFIDYTPTTELSNGDFYAARTTQRRDQHNRKSQPTEREKTAMKLGEWMRMTTHSESSFVPPVSGLSICSNPGGPDIKRRHGAQHGAQSKRKGTLRSNHTGDRTPGWAR